MYLSEIFPSTVREQGQSFASFWLWLLTAAVAGLFPVFAAASTGFAFLFFVVAMLTQSFIVLMFFPETRGRFLDSTEHTSSATQMNAQLPRRSP